MTLNSDNAMARFLFAILKQKNLKDIDWNQVASDPVLLEPITNGHAARMRYSRFRATVTGQPPKRRVSGEKPRVTKPKKDSTKKDKRLIKSESTPSLRSYAQFSPASTSITSPYIGETQDDFKTRFLTPCSDDMTQGLVVHPAALEDPRLQNVPLFPPTDCNTDFLSHAGHDQHSSPTFDAFDTVYDLSSYASTDINSQDPSNAATSQSLADWSERFQDTQHY